MAVAFHNATSAQGNPVASQSFALPTISAGDVILLFVSWQPTGAVTISGAGTWTHQGTDSLIAAQLQVGLWTAISASGSESGQNVTINVASQEKFAAIAMSYSGVDNTTPLQSGPTYAQNTTSNTTSATAPSVSPSPSTWVLEGYASKSSTNASYTTPSSTTSRQLVFGAGAGACDFAVFDTNASVSSGGGQTSTLGTATANKIAVTVVLTTAQVLLAEAGTGTDGIAITATVPLSDAGTGADRFVGANQVTLSDAGTAADRIAVTATVPLGETGAGADGIAITATVPLAESGTGTDGVSAGVAITLSDHGAGVDGLTVTNVILLAETGTAADRITITATVPLSDAGTGTEGFKAGIGLGDVGTAADRLTVTVTVVLSDHGSGADGLGRALFPHGRTFATAVISGRTYALVVNSGQTKMTVLHSGQTSAAVGVSGQTTATSQ